MSAGAETGARAETLTTLLKDGAGIAAIEAHLDALDPDARVAEVKGCPGSLLSKLYALAEGRRLTLVDLTPEVGREEIFVGNNSMPLFRPVEKHFLRTAQGEVAGFNRVPLFQWFSGPGYFVATDSDKGEVVFDYTKLPSFQPDGWLKRVGNSSFPTYAIVFGGLIDTNRRVSKDTFIGSAVKWGRSAPYFLVTRLPPGSKT